MQVVFLVNLALNLAVDSQAQQKWVLLASGRRRILLILIEVVGQATDSAASVAHFLFDRILKIARELLDLLYLLLQVTAQASEGENDILLNVPCLARLRDGSLIVSAYHLDSVVNAGRLEKVAGRVEVVGGIVEFAECLGALLIMRLNLAEVGNEVLEDLSPS